MVLKLLLLYERFITIVTFESLDAQMPSLVLRLVGMTLEFAIAKFTRKSLDTIMLVLVHFECCSGSKCLVALIAAIRTSIAVNILVRG